MLEAACRVAFGFEPKSINDYVAGHPAYRIIKLHGSVNWAAS